MANQKETKNLDLLKTKNEGIKNTFIGGLKNFIGNNSVMKIEAQYFKNIDNTNNEHLRNILFNDFFNFLKFRKRIGYKLAVEDGKIYVGVIKLEFEDDEKKDEKGNPILNDYYQMVELIRTGFKGFPIVKEAEYDVVDDSNIFKESLDINKIFDRITVKYTYDKTTEGEFYIQELRGYYWEIKDNKKSIRSKFKTEKDLADGFSGRVKLDDGTTKNSSNTNKNDVVAFEEFFVKKRTKLKIGILPVVEFSNNFKDENDIAPLRDMVEEWAGMWSSLIEETKLVKSNFVVPEGNENLGEQLQEKISSVILGNTRFMRYTDQSYLKPSAIVEGINSVLTAIPKDSLALQQISGSISYLENKLLKYLFQRTDNENTSAQKSKDQIGLKEESSSLYIDMKRKFRYYSWRRIFIDILPVLNDKFTINDFSIYSDVYEKGKKNVFKINGAIKENLNSQAKYMNAKAKTEKEQSNNDEKEKKEINDLFDKSKEK